MSQQVGFYFALLAISAMVCGGITLYSWSKRKTPAILAFTWLMLGVTVWLWGYAFELVSVELPGMLLGVKIGYLGVSFVPTLWLIFALLYAGLDRGLKLKPVVLFVIPLIILLLNWTNEWHRLYYTDFGVDLTGPFPRLYIERGLLYWGGVVYSYVMLLASTVVLVQMYIRTAVPYRSQIRIMLIAALGPWIANVLYLSGLNPLPYLNLTPLGFALTGVVMAWGLFRFQLLDIVPVARDRVVEHMQDGVIILDAQKRVVDINPRALALVSGSHQEIIGQAALEVLSPSLNLSEEHFGPQETSAQLFVDDAGERYYDLFILPLRDRREVPTGWLIVLRDLSARILAEMALRKQTQELEARNAELDAFAHTVAHDLKTPLTVIIGFAGLLESKFEHMPRELVSDNLQKLSRAGHKMNSIIDEILLLSSVREMQDVQVTPLNMDEVLGEVQLRLSGMFEACECALTLPEGWPVAVGYAPWIEEVWFNYISNAIKYGGVPPYIELGFVRQADGQIRFFVKDNGPGLTAEQQALLFSSFTRFHEMRAEGHGLGLSIVRRIMDKLGGAVGVESVIGQGSTFWFSLPESPAE